MNPLRHTIVLLFGGMILAGATGTAAAQPVADHLQCFKIKDVQQKASYTADLVPALPALPASDGCRLKVPAKLLCADVRKQNVDPAPPGAPVGNAAQLYLCYKARCPAVDLPFDAADQFGTRTVALKSTKLVCAPLATTTTTTLPPTTTVPETTTTLAPTTTTLVETTTTLPQTTTTLIDVTTTLAAAACSSAPACDGGQACTGDGDCRSGSCVSGVCAAATFGEVEPNDDGSINSGAFINGNDFSAANANGPFTGDVIVQGAITPTGDEDVYRISNPTGAPLNVRLETFSGPGACAGIDTVLVVRDGSGAVVTSDDESGIASCSLINLTLPVGSDRYVQVVDFQDNSVIASYRLEIDYE